MNHTLDAIAWTLIHFCWQAAAITLLYRVALFAVPRASSETRYTLSLAALVLMVGGALATFTFEMYVPRLSPALHIAATEMRNVAFGTAAPHEFGAGATTSTPGTNAFSANLLRWIDGLWLLGVLVLSFRSIGGWWLIRRLRATALVEAPAAVRASFERISEVLGLRRPVLLRVTGAIAGPITVGAVRAMVLLPLSAITLLGTEELEMVLAHELAHVRRADFLCNLLQTLLETLFFFHPAVWWIGKRIRHERELCCDDLALKICPNPVMYATALFRLEEQRARQWRLAMALDGQSNQTLRTRIARILGEPASPSVGRSIQPFSLAVAAIALVLSLLAAPPVVASFNPAHAATAKTAALATTGKAIAAAPELRAIAPKPGASHLLAQAGTPAPQPAAESNPGTKSTYMDRMKAAGYDVDLDKFIAMKIQGVTPEFAQSMAQAGFGKLSADDLIASKIHGVSPDSIAQMKQLGLQVKSIQDAISFRIFEITPEFVAGMKSAGFADLTSQQLLSLRVQGVTPEYAHAIAQQFPGATVDDVIKTRIFRIDSSFIEQARKFGLNPLSIDKLVKLRISGLLDDESVKQ